MNYILLIILISIILYFIIKINKKRSKIPCERCGEIGKIISYFNSSSDATRDYYKLFGNFYYEKPLKLCLWCTIAHDSFLREINMLSIEENMNFGRNNQIKKAKEIWGDRAINMIALLNIARDDMDSIRRILTEEDFKKVKPWIEKTLIEVKQENE